MAIGTINRQPNRNAGTFGKQTALDAFFSPVRRVWAGFSPRPAGLLSWHRPLIATTSQFLSIRHNLSMPSSRVSEKHRLLPIPEIESEPYCWNKYLFHLTHSTDSPFATQKKSHPLLCGLGLSACRRQNDVCSDALELTARSFPITHLKFYIGSLFCVFSSVNPFEGIIAYEYIGNSGVISYGFRT